MFTVITVITIAAIQPQLEVVMPTDDQRLVNNLYVNGWAITEDRMTIATVVHKSISATKTAPLHVDLSACATRFKHRRQKVPP